jgi:ATP-dependent helicase HepA
MFNQINEIAPGQRWVSDTESELGLGLVMEVENRRATVLFPAGNETRVYVKSAAPLTRVRFSIGDLIESSEGWKMKTLSVMEDDGLLIYEGLKEDGSKAQLTESELSSFIQFNKPQDRLFAGQIDSNSWFDLRFATLIKYNETEKSLTRGLCGVRAGLIPHQIYIAAEVADRVCPRVLLADEVGLGKTIEAGYILHRQLMVGRASRVLIIVPESLCHQWLVEMLRRFNLRFSLFDENRCSGFEEENPFLSEQLMICSLEFFKDNPNRREEALNGEWDILVVDEAHHLVWEEEKASKEYLLIESFAKEIPSLLLLTATPEQLGLESHFARLRLLDPKRFFDFKLYLEEVEKYEPIAKMVQSLLNKKKLDFSEIKILEESLSEDKIILSKTLENSNQPDDSKEGVRQQIVESLLDQHGTSRVLFRNTRNTVKGFPKRITLPEPLPFPKEYSSRFIDKWKLAKGKKVNTDISIKGFLFPEVVYRKLFGKKHTPFWWMFDSRVNWLIQKLKELSEEKVLIICSRKETVLDLNTALRERANISVAVFHEDMSIIARDRAAAYFAEIDGARVLICSEIGSEGRNFQFSRNLILFDLPMNPDLLEQRIGRLDRIGQKYDIQIHIPYLEGSSQESMFRWYQEGLNAFEKSCSFGYGVFQSLKQEMNLVLESKEFKEDDLKDLILKTKILAKATREKLESGRDLLLEINSCRSNTANQLIDEIKLWDGDKELESYLENVCSCYGIDMENHSDNCFILRPGDNMFVSSFPELKDEGVTVTFDREKALAREDMGFLTWEHPMIRGAMDLVFNGEFGNTAFATVKDLRIDSGTVLLETIFIIECVAPLKVQVNRFLPPTPLRILLDSDFRDQNKKFPFEFFQNRLESMEAAIASDMVRKGKDTIEAMLKKSQILAEKKIQSIVKASKDSMEKVLSNEINRLRELKKINPNIRDKELVLLEKQKIYLSEYMNNTKLHLDAIRVILCG